MKPFQTQAHIRSLNGAMDEITVLDERMNGRQTTYIVEYRGVKCTAIFNWFTCTYYADDFSELLRRTEMNKYTELKIKQEKEINAFPLSAAFSKEQLQDSRMYFVLYRR